MFLMIILFYFILIKKKTYSLYLVNMKLRTSATVVNVYTVQLKHHNNLEIGSLPDDCCICLPTFISKIMPLPTITHAYLNSGSVSISTLGK